MSELIKLTNEKMTTYDDMKWVVGEIYTKEHCDNPELCSPDVFHAYTNLNLALLLNPIHAGYDPFRIFSAEGEVIVSDYDKVGTFDLTLTKELDIPEWYCDSDTKHRVQIVFAILCAETVVHVYENNFPEDDRPRKAIETAKEYLNNPSEDATEAARAAVNAAYAAAGATEATEAAEAARAAYAAAEAAYAAARAADDIDFGLLADQAVEFVLNNDTFNSI
jgi:hypothetical protein